MGQARLSAPRTHKLRAKLPLHPGNDVREGLEVPRAPRAAQGTTALLPQIALTEENVAGAPGQLQHASFLQQTVHMLKSKLQPMPRGGEADVAASDSCHGPWQCGRA